MYMSFPGLEKLRTWIVAAVPEDWRLKTDWSGWILDAQCTQSYDLSIK